MNEVKMTLPGPTCLSIGSITGKAQRLVLTSILNSVWHVKRKLHFSTPRLSMQFISMYLSFPFEPSSNGHHYALSIICMLTEYMLCIPFKAKTACEVVQTYKDEVYAKFVECKVYSPPYHPQSNGRPKGFHNFLKACMSKLVPKSLEWGQVILLACTAYNFLPNVHSKESPFSLCLVGTALFCLTHS